MSLQDPTFPYLTEFRQENVCIVRGELYLQLVKSKRNLHNISRRVRSVDTSPDVR
jgi:hypothetical protein